MSMLIDVIVAKGKEWPTTEIDGKWYIAKPMSLFSTRVGWVIEVLRGKAEAMHYKQDELLARLDAALEEKPCPLDGTRAVDAEGNRL